MIEWLVYCHEHISSIKVFTLASSDVPRILGLFYLIDFERFMVNTADYSILIRILFIKRQNIEDVFYRVSIAKRNRPTSANLFIPGAGKVSTCLTMCPCTVCPE